MGAIKFKDVKIGMAGITYNDELVIIIKKGTVKELATESEIFSFGIEDFQLNENAVRVKNNFGDEYFYFYGSDVFVIPGCLLCVQNIAI